VLRERERGGIGEGRFASQKDPLTIVRRQKCLLTFVRSKNETSCTGGYSPVFGLLYSVF
jgi:hypothetical protein